MAVSDFHWGSYLSRKVSVNLQKQFYEATTNHPRLTNKIADLVSKNVKCGYQMPITIEASNKIKDRVIALYGIIEQNALSDLGEKVPKNQLIHYQYFCFS